MGGPRHKVGDKKSLHHLTTNFSEKYVSEFCRVTLSVHELIECLQFCLCIWETNFVTTAGADASDRSTSKNQYW